MYCGNCFRDNALVSALRRQGHDTLMVPLYLPMTLDEMDTRGNSPTLFGGINVFLSQKLPWHRRSPAWLRRWFDAPWLLKWASGKAAGTRAEDVGDINLSMLRGEEGNQARELDELIAWLKGQGRPDVILLSNALLTGLARRLKSELRSPVIVFLQSEESFLDSISEPWRTRSWEVLRERAREVDGWIAPSRYFAGRMTERLGLSESRVRVVNNGILLEGYPLEPRSIVGHLSPTLGYFARMCPEKGLDIVVDAYIELRRRNRVPHLQLRIGGGCGAGDEAFVGGQKQKLSDAKILGDCVFAPNLSRAEKIAFYAACDVLSVPARQSEAFGLYVIESMAAGTPLVQPSVATFPELLEETGGGVLYAPNTAGALADALEPLLGDLPRLRMLGELGRRAVRDRFTDATMASGTVEGIQSLLGAGVGAGNATGAVPVLEVSHTR